MKKLALLAIALITTPVLAQEAGRSDDYNEGYRRGFKDGFRDGVREAEKRPPPPPTIVAPPPKPGPTGPITITNAYYGTSSKNCNATHWLARRVNGRLTASVDVGNGICGDPAPGARKSLEVTYICGRFVKTASAFEHRTAYLDCTS